MPPSWPSRLLSGSSTPTSNTAAPSPSSRTTSYSKPLPAVPCASQPTLLAQPPSPTRSSTPRQPTHTRSSSHPLPRLFSRKKSSGALKQILDSDTPLDDTLVPILDGPSAASPSRTPTYKRKDDPNALGQCMCCDSRVRFPRELRVFRCTNCLTINDLTALTPSGGPGAERERKELEAGRQAPYLLGPKRQSCPWLQIKLYLTMSQPYFPCLWSVLGLSSISA